MISREGAIVVEINKPAPAIQPPTSVTLEMSLQDATGLAAYLAPLRGNGGRILAALKTKGIYPNEGLVINDGKVVTVRGWMKPPRIKDGE